MSATATAVPTTITPAAHQFMQAGIDATGDYATDCLSVATEALRGVGCTHVSPEPSMGCVVTCEDGDDTVVAGVVLVGSEDYGFSLCDLESVIDSGLESMLAVLCIRHALSVTPLPLSLRGDVLSVCLDPERGRARVHHVKGVWRG